MNPDPTPYTGIPGIEAFALPAMPHPARVVISRERPPQPSTRITDEWDKLLRKNPGLFNGPILSVLNIDHSAGRVELTCRRDHFQRLCVQPAVHTGVRLLSVTGILTAADAKGRPHVFVGKRSPRTRIFGDLWELGPSGGVDPPPLSTELLDEPMILLRLIEEIAEEAGEHLGERVEHAPARLVAITRDQLAFSDDLCVQFSLGDLGDQLHAPSSGNWEYTQTRWIPLDELHAWDAEHAREIIPASRALFRVLGWITD